MVRQTTRKLSSKASVGGKRRHDASPQPGEAKRRRSSPADVTEAGLLDDSKFSLAKIRDSYGIPIVKMMKEIQETRIERVEASVFVRHLECLRIVDDGDIIKFQKSWINAFDVKCAIVSWSWSQPTEEREVTGSCFIGSRQSTVQYSVWRRAVDYMRHEKTKYLWIDAECLPQESEAKAKAISEMDWLYHHGKRPFGILTRTIKKETELHLLAQILQGEDFSLKKGNTAEAWPAVHLLNKITSDIWWTRAWIYQENYHGGTRMNLLMRYERELETSKARHADLFAFIRSSPPRLQKGAARRILSRAQRYSELLKRRSSMSPTIIADVGKRDVTNHPDRLPISANCCSYNIRLDIDKLDKKRHSISVAILVLFLLNGEIFCERSRDTLSPSDLTVVDFIKSHAFEGFSPPSFLKYKLTFNKKCRFVEPRLARNGVLTRGHLWQLCKRTIDISCEQAGKWRTVKGTLWGLQKYMEEYEHRDGLELACRLKEMREELPEEALQTPAAQYMCEMAETITDALKNGGTLRLAFLCNSSGNRDWSPPTAVFICPDEALDSDGPSFVFTSFREKNTSHGPGYNDVDKHVSLQVDVKNNGELSARSWMHGLWFCTWPSQPVVFSLPFILNEL